MNQTNSNAVAHLWLAALLVTGLLYLAEAAAQPDLGVSGLDMTSIVVEPANSATLHDLVARLRDERLVYVGETHTAYADHLLQLAVLRGMATQGGELALGVEWFQARFQPVLDDYIAGRIDEAEMLRRSEYYQRWRFDYRLYRPILQFAREHGIPVIALNASRELTTAISRHGINELPHALRDELPDSYDVNNAQYRDILRTLFNAHPGAAAGDFDRFVEVQLTWDESMAQRAAAYLTAKPQGRILVLAGRGHIAGRFGIPDRVTRRVGVRGVTVLSHIEAGQPFAGADYLVLAGERSLPPTGLMRVMLDEREDGLFITGFANGSPARGAGVEEGDRLLSINGRPIRDYTDVRIAMLDLSPGHEIEVGIQRRGLFGGTSDLSLRVTLVADSGPTH